MKKKLKFTLLICLALLVTAVGAVYAKYTDTVTQSFNLKVTAYVYEVFCDTFGGAFSDATTTWEASSRSSAEFTLPSDEPYRQFFTFGGWSGGAYTDAPVAAGATVTAPRTGPLELIPDWEVDLDSYYSGAVTVEATREGATAQLHLVDGCEVFAFPITRLINGIEYTVSFDFVYTGTVGEPAPHFFGYGVSNRIPSSQYEDENPVHEKTGSITADGYVESLASATTKKTFTHTFEATANTMYLYVCACALSDDSGEATLSFTNMSCVEAEEYIYITNVNEWNEFAESVNDGSYDGSKAVLGNDIDFANEEIVLAGTETRPFTGEFIGQDLALVNVNYNGSGAAAPFAYAEGANIWGFNLEDSTFITSDSFAGGVVAHGVDVTLSNCNVTNSIIRSENTSDWGGVGGLAGSLTYTDQSKSTVNVSDCDVTNTTVRGRRDVGGFVGDLTLGYIKDCSVVAGSTGEVIADLMTAGGFAGKVHGSTVELSSTNAAVSCGGENVGAFVGYNYSYDDPDATGNDGTTGVDPKYTGCICNTSGGLPAIGTSSSSTVVNPGTENDAEWKWNDDNP